MKLNLRSDLGEVTSCSRADLPATFPLLPSRSCEVLFADWRQLELPAGGNLSEIAKIDEASARPGNYRLRLHNDQGLGPAMPQLAERNPEQLIRVAPVWEGLRPLNTASCCRRAASTRASLWRGTKMRGCRRPARMRALPVIDVRSTESPGGNHPGGKRLISLVSGV
jgi:hypothetical protein